MQSLSKRLPLSLLIGGPILLGLALLWWSFRPFGPGISIDSTNYTSLAENLRHGHGYATSIIPWGEQADPLTVTQWPPLYVLLLALLTSLFGDNGAALLDYAFFAASTALVAWIVYQKTARKAAALLASMAMVFAPAMWIMHAYALTEAPFLLAVLLSLWWQARYLATQQHRYWVAAGLAAAAAVLTRYVGLPLLATGLLTVVWATRGSVTRRGWVAVGWSSVVAIPLALWLGRNMLVAGHVAGQWGTSDRSLVQFSLDSVASVVAWFDPTVLPGPLSALGLLVVLGGLLYGINQRRTARPAQPAGWTWLRGYALFVGCYTGLLLLLATRVSTAGQAARYLAPVFPPLLIMGVSYLSVQLADGPARQRRQSALVAAALAITVVVLPAVGTLRQILYTTTRTDGIGYRGARWRESPTVQAVGHSAGPFQIQPRIYSNIADVLWYYSRRSMYFLPPPTVDMTTALVELHKVALTTPTLIVFMYPYGAGTVLPNEQTIAASPQFRRIAQYTDGAVYAPIP